MNVEVCYAEVTRATRITVTLPPTATLADALAKSDIMAALALDATVLTFAVFGRRATPDTPLADGDRVELLRPLSVDPKEARRRRVAKRQASAR